MPGGGKEAKRRRALIRSGVDPEAAKAAAAKEFAAVRAKQEQLEAAAAAKESAAKRLREKRKREERMKMGDEGAKAREAKRQQQEEQPAKTGKKRKRVAADEVQEEEVLQTPKKKVKGDPNLTVFVGQLPFKVDAKMLEEHFLKVGIEEVASVRMLTDKTTNKSRGMAFVQFSSEEDVLAALQLHQSELCGRWINVERSSVKSASEKPAKLSKRSDAAADGKIDRALSVFVAKLPYSATAKSIREHFEAAGVEGVVAVKMLSEKVTNKKGMAFVQLSSEEGVSAALELHESQFGSRSIVVERSKPSQNDANKSDEE
mmetsp:Transcript_105973/g.167292  ORF Transcript_105973/g.167292 Transcript_105973/m.167292 type:complete len:316 (+) Transcript_105973:52-999(+)|eukprot:CAMPEP_0169112638 /NCGR_PEP_ID=MMETSP1015-20121227/27749_1 /TAXON_ID=342587 /ORGANISM="Karlodinium micrum, Strain CCMP2283" /LENGTH=315 /DNA_ID=CAMNT_0009174703 /DNA_START=52 /DNA_END=999 /DNA_ORIENTATION=+